MGPRIGALVTRRVSIPGQVLQVVSVDHEHDSLKLTLYPWVLQRDPEQVFDVMHEGRCIGCVFSVAGGPWQARPIRYGAEAMDQTFPHFQLAAAALVAATVNPKEESCPKKR